MLKIKHIHILLLALCLLFTGCGINTPQSVPSDTESIPGSTAASYEEGSHALLIYMCGSNLESRNGAATKNIAEMLEAELPEKTQVFIQTGGTKKWRNYNIPADQSCRYKVKNGELCLLEQNSLVNMGESDSLSDFLMWSYETCPAENYSLILWDHGGGSVKGVCYDENYGMDALSLPELKAALSDFYEKTGGVLEFIGFDACLMATVETAFTVEPYAQNMVASEELEPSGGWNYKVLLENLGQPDFYEKLLTSYAEKSKDKDYYTLSHIDLSGFSVIADAVDGLIARMKTAESPRYVVSAVNSAASFGTDGTDLYDLGNLLASFGVIDVGMENCISYVNGEHRSDATGLSIYFPIDDGGSLTEYCQCTPHSAYADYLTAFFTVKDEEKIHFKTYAENINEMLSFTLQDDSMDYVGRIEYVLYGFESASEYTQKVFALGNDDDVTVVGNRVDIGFEGKWVEFGGHLLYCKISDKQGASTIYEAPIRVNGENALLLFAHDKTNWSIHVIGVTYESEDFSRIYELKTGDKIIGVVKDATYGKAENLYPEENEFVYDETQNISIITLPNGYYQYTAYITDVYGKRYTAGTAVVKITDGTAKIIALTDAETTYPE